MKPLLLLDVDGVILPFGVDSVSSQDYDARQYQEMLADLSEHFEIHWCTGWQDEANDIISPMVGLGRIPVVPMDFDHHHDAKGLHHWKHGTILKYLEDHPDRPYAFVDDDITATGVYWAENDSDRPCLWLQTRASIGLTREHVEILIAWVDSL